MAGGGTIRYLKAAMECFDIKALYLEDSGGYPGSASPLQPPHFHGRVSSKSFENGYRALHPNSVCPFSCRGAWRVYSNVLWTRQLDSNGERGNRWERKGTSVSRSSIALIKPAVAKLSSFTLPPIKSRHLCHLENNDDQFKAWWSSPWPVWSVLGERLIASAGKLAVTLDSVEKEFLWGTYWIEDKLVKCDDWDLDSRSVCRQTGTV